MYAANSAKLSLITFFLLIFSLFLIVQGAPLVEKSSKNKNIIYTRYMRRRPSEYPNDLYVDDFVEVLRVRQKPTPSYLLSDDEVDRIIRCDFDPQLRECDDLAKSTTVRSEVVTSTRLPTTTVTLASSTTTTTSVPLASSTTTTTTQIPLVTTTEDLPFLPDISVSVEETSLAPIDPDVEILENTSDTNEYAENNENNEDDDYTSYNDIFDENEENTLA